MWGRGYIIMKSCSVIKILAVEYRVVSVNLINPRIILEKQHNPDK